MQYISVKDLKSNMDNSDNVKILDVRERYEFNICKIDTLNIPMAEIGNRIDEIPRDRDVAVLCKSGKRASAVANLLATEYGFKSLSVVKGGIEEWIAKIDNKLEMY
jgi:adenylyltransferase/sulfurtransferase